MNGAVPIGLTQLKYETNGWVESVAGAVTAVVSLDPSSGDLTSCGECGERAGSSGCGERVYTDVEDAVGDLGVGGPGEDLSEQGSGFVVGSAVVRSEEAG